MKIISFTGKSGTGKSYQAIRICIEKNIDGIIDDGLFIYKGKVMAGSSAKKCATKAGAVKTALFHYEKNADAVKKAIARCKPNSLMVIGTSDRMTSWICEALGLHEPDERLYIEDYTTEEEREIAFHSRHDEGNHVIPAPMGELKRDFAGYFMNPLLYLRDLVIENAGKEYNADRDITVVRPNFSYFGKFSISAKAIRDIVDIISDDYEKVLAVDRIQQYGRTSKLTIYIDIKILRGINVADECGGFQKRVHDAIEEITSFSVSNVNIKITELCRTSLDLRGNRL